MALVLLPWPKHQGLVSICVLTNMHLQETKLIADKLTKDLVCISDEFEVGLSHLHCLCTCCSYSQATYDQPEQHAPYSQALALEPEGAGLQSFWASSQGKLGYSGRQVGNQCPPVHPLCAPSSLE